MEGSRIGAIGSLWFVFWRMTLWGLGLGLGAAYGTLVGIPFGISARPWVPCWVPWAGFPWACWKAWS